MIGQEQRIPLVATSERSTSSFVRGASKRHRSYASSASVAAEATAECPYSSSGCKGGLEGDATEPCMPGLTGKFCLLCANASGQYYASATDDEPARCLSCKGTMENTIGVGFAIAILLDFLHCGGVRPGGPIVSLHRVADLERRALCGGTRATHRASSRGLGIVSASFVLFQPTARIFGAGIDSC